MKITTNVAKFNGQAKMITDVIEGYLGKDSTLLEKVEEYLNYQNYCRDNKSPAPTCGKTITTDLGRCNLLFNEFNGNVKLQFKVKTLKLVIPGLQA